MPEEKDKKKEFLDKFTEEMIMNTVREIKDRQKFERDLERAKRAIAIEKLKLKFNEYGEKPAEKPEEKKEPAKKEIPEEKQRVLPVMPSQIAPAIPAKPAPIIPAKPKELQVTNITLPPKTAPAAPGEINFGKILPLIRDPAITYIECPGIEKNIIIKRAGVTTKTQITMAREEILALIKSFSEKARIPLIEGMLNARVDNLEISAVVTETGSPSFIIRKIIAQIIPTEPRKIEAPMMKFPGPGMPLRPAAGPAMPPVTRPFTPGAFPGAPRAAMPKAEQKKEENFFNKKIKIG